MLVFLSYLCISTSSFFSILSTLYCYLSHKRDVEFYKKKSVFCTIAFFSFVFSLSFLLSFLSSFFQYIDTNLPFSYKLISLWSYHEGSILFVFFLATLINFIFSLLMRDEYHVVVQSIQNIFIFSIGLFIIFFIPLDFGIPFLNPLLQDHGLFYHPPTLFTSFILFSYLHSALIAYLLRVEYKDNTSFYFIRSLSILTLSLLFFGILSGSYWAYRELGWGGLWFWDPVENISLTLLLLLCCFIHFFLYCRYNKNIVPAITIGLLLFPISVFGVFIIRSGLLVSVHNFSDVGFESILIGVFSIVLIVMSFCVFYYKIVKKNIDKQNKIKSNSFVYSLFVASILFLYLFTIVFISLIYPLIIYLIYNEKSSFSSEYFLYSFIPIYCMLVFFIGLFGNNKDTIIKNFCSLFFISLLTFFFLFFIQKEQDTLLTICQTIYLSIHFWTISNIKLHFYRNINVYLIHLLFVSLFLFLGVSYFFDKQYSYQRSLGDFSFSFYEVDILSLEEEEEEQYKKIILKIRFFNKKSGEFFYLLPENRIYKSDGTITYETDIYHGITHDVHAVFFYDLSDKSNPINIFIRIKPGVTIFLSIGLIIVMLIFLQGIIINKKEKYEK